MLSEGQRLNKCHELVREFIDTKLYPPEKRDDGLEDLDYSVGIITSFGFQGMWYVYLDTTLPDDIIYRAAFDKLGTQETDPVALTAYKKLEDEDLSEQPQRASGYNIKLPIH